jgi:hypothetical protein
MKIKEGITVNHKLYGKGEVKGFVQGKYWRVMFKDDVRDFHPAILIEACTLSDNPTLLDLLQFGCTVEFPNGYSLRGDPDNRYIDCLANGSKDGVWQLTEQGVIKALEDAENFNNG